MPPSLVSPLRKPSSLSRTVSPPPAKRSRESTIQKPSESATKESALRLKPKTSAVESGEADVEDHLGFFSAKLTAFTRPSIKDGKTRSSPPRLTQSDWVNLYNAHANLSTGHHFVVHQHDHPVAGSHYDLRLQCNASSSLSFAIMYGLPGDPNSRKITRNATETRIHNLWNHLIETASHSTGTMLIWDTGQYEILPYYDRDVELADSGEGSEDSIHGRQAEEPEPQKLHEAFHRRKIRLRLHGTKLPKGYTVIIRLTSDNNRTEQPKAPSRKRKREAPTSSKSQSTRRSTQDSQSSDTEAGNGAVSLLGRRTQKSSLISLTRTESPPSRPDLESNDEEDADLIRRTNTYPGGAINSIDSIHQRKWYLSLDRRGSGFIPSRTKDGTRVWVRRQLPDKSHGTQTDDGSVEVKIRSGERAGGFEKFHVMGREVERSVVTGRLAREILEDEGVAGYVPRGLWRPVVE